MDIRRFFQQAPTTKASAEQAPLPPQPEVKLKPKTVSTSGRKKTIIPVSDEEDDEEDFKVEVKSKHFSDTKPTSSLAEKVEVVDPKAFFASPKTKKSTEPGSSSSSTHINIKEAVKAPPANASSSTALLPSSKTITTAPSSSKATSTTTAMPNTKPKAYSTGRSANAFSDSDDDADAVESKVAGPKKLTGAASKEGKIEIKQSSIKAAVPASSNKRKKNAVSEDDDDDDFAAEDDDDERDAPQGKKASSSKATTKAAPKAKKVKADDHDDDEDAVVVQEKPKPKFNYMAYKNKAGPSALGSKEIPVGKANCLSGLTFVFTGELSSITRDDATELVKRYSGRVTGSPSGKTSYVVVGDDAGQSKLDKVKKLKIKTVDEDGFLDLIATLPERTDDGDIVKATAPKASIPAVPAVATASSNSMAGTKRKASGSASVAVDISDDDEIKKEQPATKKSTTSKEVPLTPPKNADGSVPADLWTTKYMPKQLNELCGNGPAVKRLEAWLRDWDDNYAKDFKIPGPEKTGNFRAVLISGPPGIGKTSAAHLVAKAAGFSVVEFNASDTRSKKSLEQNVRDLLNNQSLGGYFLGSKAEEALPAVKGKGKAAAAPISNSPTMSQKQVIVMDEVDGMGGGDRGGMAQLISFIKKTHVPIICLCNDRQSTKVRSLVNSCYDMRFARPTAQQIRARLMTVLHKEQRKIPPNVLDNLVTGSQSDIRQVLNMLSTWSLTRSAMDFDESKALAKDSAKYISLNPFQIAESLLTESSYRGLSLADKFDLYFNDYQLAPLMIQENYIKMEPADAKGFGRESDLKTLELLSKAADSISDSDLVDGMIRGSQQQWGLLPVHAAFSCVRPSFFMHGRCVSQGYGPAMSFPSYLGQFSKTGKYMRLVREVQIRMRLKISADKNETRQSYLPALFPVLTGPLVKDGADAISELIELMDSYFLTKEDWDTILELGIGKNDGKQVLDQIPSAVKAAFTRQYNASDHPQPFLKPVAVSKVRGAGAGGVGGGEAPDNMDVLDVDEPVPDETEENAGNDDDDDIDKDRNIKKLKTAGGKAKGKSAGAGSAKGKAKAPTSRARK